MNLIAIVGPTASGKTEMAIALAQELRGEVINADTRQFYSGMDIGTAKPTAAQRNAVPHHLLDFLHPAERFSVAQFLPLATAAARGISSRGALPILAGGSGQYIRALLGNWRIPAAPPDPRLRARLEGQLRSEGPEALAQRLARMDPAAASRIDLRNPRRVIRAIERASAPPAAATPPQDPQGRADLSIRVIGIAIQRQELHRRVAQRVDAMLDAGWQQEVQGLLQRGVTPQDPGMAAIGYQHLCNPRLEPGEIAAAIRRDTHRLIRHQNNWFKPGDPAIRWVAAGDHAAAVRAARQPTWSASESVLIPTGGQADKD